MLKAWGRKFLGAQNTENGK